MTKKNWFLYKLESHCLDFTSRLNKIGEKCLARKFSILQWRILLSSFALSGPYVFVSSASFLHLPFLNVVGAVLSVDGCGFVVLFLLPLDIWQRHSMWAKLQSRHLQEITCIRINSIRDGKRTSIKTWLRQITVAPKVQ